jgi:hypothetical protein
VQHPTRTQAALDDRPRRLLGLPRPPLVLQPAALALSALPAAAVPDAGEPVPAEQPLVRWGWADGEGPAYPGQRFGTGEPLELRGPVLEFVDR